MNLTAILFGILLGGIIGILVTDLSWKELREQASVAFRESRLVKLWTTREGNWFGQIV